MRVYFWTDCLNKEVNICKSGVNGDSSRNSGRKRSSNIAAINKAKAALAQRKLTPKKGT
jgi:hypothetical protein